MNSYGLRDEREKEGKLGFLTLHSRVQKENRGRVD